MPRKQLLNLLYSAFQDSVTDSGSTLQQAVARWSEFEPAGQSR